MTNTPDTIAVTYQTLVAPETLLDLVDGDRCFRSGYLTTDSAASSHGLPVLHDGETGQALGSAECGEVVIDTYIATDDVAGRDVHRALAPHETAIVEAARVAGYTVRVAQ